VEQLAGSDDSYWVFYGADVPSAPLDDPAQVFAVWDDFDGSGPGGWSFDLFGAATGTEQRGNGVLRLEGQTGNIYNPSDDFLFIHRPVSGDFVAEVYVASSGGTLGDWADPGGVMVRQHLGGASQHVMGSLVLRPDIGAQTTYRLADGGPSGYQVHNLTDPLPGYLRVSRLGSEVSVHYSADGRAWEAADTPRTVTDPFVDPVFVGVPFTNGDTGSAGWVEVGWFRLRSAVAPEPTIAIGDEQLVVR
jgi:hypothetical protein